MVDISLTFILNFYIIYGNTRCCQYLLFIFFQGKLLKQTEVASKVFG